MHVSTTVTYSDYIFTNSTRNFKAVQTPSSQCNWEAANGLIKKPVFFCTIINLYKLNYSKRYTRFSKFFV